MLKIPQVEQFHICPAVAAWIVDVEVFDIYQTSWHMQLHLLDACYLMSNNEPHLAGLNYFL